MEPTSAVGGTGVDPREDEKGAAKAADLPNPIDAERVVLPLLL